jgi:hypothetical protein
MTGADRHCRFVTATLFGFVGIGRVVRHDDHSLVVGLIAKLPEQLFDLIIRLAVSASKVPPLRSIDESEATWRKPGTFDHGRGCPIVPVGDAVLVQKFNLVAAGKECQQLADEHAQAASEWTEGEKGKLVRSNVDDGARDATGLEELALNTQLFESVWGKLTLLSSMFILPVSVDSPESFRILQLPRFCIVEVRQSFFSFEDCALGARSDSNRKY